MSESVTRDELNQVVNNLSNNIVNNNNNLSNNIVGTANNLQTNMDFFRANLGIGLRGSNDVLGEWSIYKQDFGTYAYYRYIKFTDNDNVVLCTSLDIPPPLIPQIDIDPETADGLATTLTACKGILSGTKTDNDNFYANYTNGGFSIPFMAGSFTITVSEAYLNFTNNRITFTEAPVPISIQNNTTSPPQYLSVSEAITLFGLPPSTVFWNPVEVFKGDYLKTVTLTEADIRNANPVVLKNL